MLACFTKSQPMSSSAEECLRKSGVPPCIVKKVARQRACSLGYARFFIGNSTVNFATFFSRFLLQL